MEKIRLRARGTTSPGQEIDDWGEDQYTCPCGTLVYGSRRCCGIRTPAAFGATEESWTSKRATTEIPVQE